MILNLFSDAYSEIIGPSAKYVAEGSELTLQCFVRNASAPPEYVFWYQGKKMVNYDTNRGITVETGSDYR